MRPGQSSYGLLALPQLDLPAQGSSAYRHPGADLLGSLCVCVWGGGGGIESVCAYVPTSRLG